MSTQTKNTKLRNEAKLVMWNYYQDNKSTLPKWIRECREEILEGLIDGNSVGKVFSMILESVQ